jgi:hypothetical protein
MRVHYDREADAIYIRLGNQKPGGVVEISKWKKPLKISDMLGSLK